MPKRKNVRPIRVEGDLAYVALTRGYEAAIDAADIPLIEGWNWHAQVDGNTVYAVRSRRQKPQAVMMHRAIMGEPKELDVDHRDGDGLNNRRANLRVATVLENQFNARRRKDNASGFKGVSWHRAAGKWYAHISLNRKRFHLGTFDTPEAAHAAYAAASAAFHGEFGRVS